MARGLTPFSKQCVAYLLGVSAIAPVWFAVTFYLCMMLISIADTTDMRTTVPLWLKIACAVAYPVRYLLPENGFTGLSDDASGRLFLLVMIVNSILWGFVIVFLFRFVAGLFSARKREITNAA
jgi:hypothetical protein